MPKHRDWMVPLLVFLAVLFFGWVFYKFYIFSTFTLSADKTSHLKIRVTEFYTNLQNKKFNIVYGMLIREIRATTPFGEYTELLGKAFGKTELNFGAIETKMIREDLGVSYVFITLKSTGDKENQTNTSVCDGAIWLWQDDNWYFFREFDCAYEKEAVKDVLQRLKKSE